MSEPLESDALRVLDRWQRGFPLTARPYAAIASAEGLHEGGLIALLARMMRQGVLSRVGATVRPNTAGASMLAAMAVPPGRLDEVAAIVNGEPGVNHNYEREHELNLWFVLTGSDRADLDHALHRIRSACGLDVVELPLERSYFIDLGFPLDSADAVMRAEHRRTHARLPVEQIDIDAVDRRLLAALEPGLPLVPEPFAALAWAAGTTTDDALARLGRLQQDGIITRLGFIVRHRQLGYDANAMSVWDVPDGRVDEVGALFAAQPYVTLCYRRPRRLPHWPYNLFCMIHGRSRALVEAQAATLTGLGGLEHAQRAVLFSRRCFRQRGPRLSPAGRSAG